MQMSTWRMPRMHIKLARNRRDCAYQRTKSRDLPHTHFHQPAYPLQATSNLTMYPTRTAPRPRETVSLPPNHPFATNFKPFDCHANSSTSSLQTPGCHAGIYPSSRSSPTTKPTGSVAKPLSPSRTSTPRRAVDDFGCFFQPHGAYSKSTKSTFESISPAYTALPVELSLFDPRPRQTLLQDVEFILGKKLRFPFMDKYTPSDKKEKKLKSMSEKENKKGRRLTEEREYDEDWSLWEGMDLVAGKVVVISSDKEKRYREERNWI